MDRAPERPNIVLILADDLGYGDVGCYGASLVDTPHVDGLAASGLRFTDAHSPSSVCTPTRYTLLTGEYCWRTWAETGCIWWHDPLLVREGRPTLASMLRGQGYTTGIVGKWHLGFGRPGCEGWDDLRGLDPNGPIAPGPCEVGFDSFFGVPAIGQKPHVYIRDHEVVDLEPEDPMRIVLDERHEWMTDYRHRPRTHNPELETEGGASAVYDHDEVTKVLTREAVAFLERHAGGERPFFLYFAVRNVHAPLIPHPDFRGTSRCGVYGDFVHELDWSVGEVLGALGRLGLAGETLVIFASDNGATEHHRPVRFVSNEGLRSNGPFRGQKSEVYEGGQRVPLIVRWPGRVAPGGTSDQLIALTDMLPTLASLVGATLPAEAAPDGFDLLSAFLGEAGPRDLRPFVVHDSMMRKMFAVRSEEWKLILGQGGGGIGAGWVGRPGIEDFGPSEPPGQLYNLADDPAEGTNLYESCPDIVRRLTETFEACRQDGRSR